jgi:hypothetical protein
MSKAHPYPHSLTLHPFKLKKKKFENEIEQLRKSKQIYFQLMIYKNVMRIL